MLSWKKTLKLRFIGLCDGKSSVTGEFPAQRASNVEMLPFGDVIVMIRKSIAIQRIAYYMQQHTFVMFHIGYNSS